MSTPLSDRWPVLSVPAISWDGAYRRFGKRALDVCGAVILLLLAFPVLFVVYLLIPLDGCGSAIFSQIRLTQSGRTFRIYKFRTMSIREDDTDNPDPAAKPVTWLGRYLRASHVDELPQLFNVLEGSMSLVGPRPLVEGVIRRAECLVPAARDRFLVKAGITGPTQLSPYRQDSDDDLLNTIPLDVSYARRPSLWTDLRLLVRTPVSILFGQRKR